MKANPDVNQGQLLPQRFGRLSLWAKKLPPKLWEEMILCNFEAKGNSHGAGYLGLQSPKQL